MRGHERSGHILGDSTSQKPQYSYIGRFVVGILGWGNDSRRRARIFLFWDNSGARAGLFFTFTYCLLSVLPTCGASSACGKTKNMLARLYDAANIYSYPPHPRPHLTLSPIQPTPRFSVCLLPTPPSERFNQLWQGAQRTRCRHQHEQTRKKGKMMTMTMMIIVVVGLMMLVVVLLFLFPSAFMVFSLGVY